MAAKKTQKTTQKNKKASGANQRVATAAQTPVLSNTIKHDIFGIALIMLAIVMFMALFSPTNAFISNFIRDILMYGFGQGAFLLPLALLLSAITFFIPTTTPISARSAVGLSMIVVAILAILSLTNPAVLQDPAYVFQANILVSSGGYLGGIVAWILLTLVGKTIGLVILAGLIITGLVICGLSISGLFVKASQMFSFLHTKRNTHRADILDQQQADTLSDSRFLNTEAQNEQKTTKDTGQMSFDEDVMPGPTTTYIGSRTTSVLPNNRAAKRKRHPALDIKDERPAQPLSNVDDAVKSLDDTASLAALQDMTGKPAPLHGIHAAAVIPEPTQGNPNNTMSLAPVQEALNKKKEEQQASQKKEEAKKAKQTKLVRPGDTSDEYVLPELSLLKSNPNSASSASSQAELKQTAERLQATLVEFGLKSKVVGWVSGPLVTTFKIEMGEGERVNRITNLEDDIALSLAAESVRIFAPIPGTSLVGIEIPNTERQSVCLGDVLPYAQGGPLELAIGRDSEGTPIVSDLASMPHLLIAGATGSGKSVMINSIIMSILMRATPDQVRLIMVDPKRVELGGYNGLPHLYVPVVTEPRQAASALQWAVSEMDRRLKVFEKAGARDIKSYNKKIEDGKFDDQENPPKNMPYLVIIIDELSDLMMVAGKDIEASIVRIAQLARAAGIHLIVATQRPSADVVTGLIKSNIENRIAFSVASGTDSRVILDQTGAERLLGRGDMLFKHRGTKPKRVLGCYVSDPEIDAAVEFIKQQAAPDYHDEILSAVVPSTQQTPGAATGASDDDPLVWQAAQLVVDSQLGSTSGLQRRLKVGYARAGRIMDMLEAKGIVGPPDGSKPREVLIGPDELEELQAAEAAYEEV